MNEKTSSSSETPGDYPLSDVPEMHSVGPSDSDIKMFKKLYLPSSKANYSPSQEKVEVENGLNSSTASNPDGSI